MFIALAQLMIALDATIVNIALPSVQAALGFSDADRQWAVTFTEPRERGKAFAIFGAIAGGGGAAGLVLGGVLTETFSWRACLFVNVPIALVAAVGAWYLRGSTRAGNGARLDIPGAALATAGLVALVLACTRAAALGWSSALVIGLLAAGATLLALFALRESRAASPLLPLRILADR